MSPLLCMYLLHANIVYKFRSLCFNPFFQLAAFIVHHVTDDDIYVIGGRNYSEKKDIKLIEKFNVKRKKWTDYLSLGEGSFTNIDCCVVRIATSNHDFSNLALALDDKWIMW